MLPSFAAQIAAIEAGRKSPRLEVGDLAAARDFLDVRDVRAAYLALLTKAPDLPMRSVYNICSGKAHTIQSLLIMMRLLSASEFEIAIDPARLRGSDVPTAVGDCERLADTTRWAPKIDIEQTLRTLLDHWREVERLHLRTTFVP